MMPSVRAIAIVERVPEQRPSFAKEAEIHAPGIDADAIELRDAGAGGRTYPALDLMP